MNSGPIQYLPLPIISGASPRKRHAESPVYFVVRGNMAPNSCASGATSLQLHSASTQQRLLCNNKVTQGAGDEQAMSVFRQPTVADFVKAKLPLDNPELMLHTCPDARLVPVFRALVFSQLSVAAAFGLGKVLSKGGVIGDRLLLAGVGGVAPNPGFFAVKQVRQDLGVVYVGRCRDHRVNEPGFTVDANMRLHAEIPLVTLFRLLHFRIALFLLVLGGTRCADDAGIDDGAAGYLHPVVLEVLVHQVEQLVAQIVLLHQMAELANRGLIRCRFAPQVDAYKVTQRLGIVQSFFGSRIGEVEPVLQEVDSQHPLDTDGSATGALRLGIVRLNSVTEFFPGNDGFHFLKELFLAGFLAVLLEAASRKRVLTHGVQPELKMPSIMNECLN